MDLTGAGTDSSASVNALGVTALRGGRPGLGASMRVRPEGDAAPLESLPSPTSGIAGVTGIGDDSKVGRQGRVSPGLADPELESGREPLRIGLIYDMDACRCPTGVTRHALAQLERLAARTDVQLRVVSGRITEPEGRSYWEKLGDAPRGVLPVRTRDALRYWRILPRPALEWWTGPLDWVYSPAEFHVRTRGARRAVTSHDVLQDIQYGSRRRTAMLAQAFRNADLVISVSHFNTEMLLHYFPFCENKVVYVPNAAEDLFFEPSPPEDNARVRADLGLPPGMPYLVSVANFQIRKNLVRLIRVAARLPEIARGEMALVLLGVGDDDQEKPVREAVAALGPRVNIVMPGYRQGSALRAVYAEAFAMVFPSLCEGFGIPVVEAMAQGVPAALADSTALPEIGGDAGWYFHPLSEDSLLATLRELLDRPEERARRIAVGRDIALRYRWSRSNNLLVQALRDFS